MKRLSLIALCIAGAVGPASAQTGPSPVSWKLIGNFDIGYRIVKHDDPTQERKFFTSGNSLTSLLIGIATLDLGGGSSASVLAEMDHNPAASSTANNSGPSGTNVYTGTPFNSEQYASVTGPYGTLKLGIPNSWGLIASLMAQPFSTGLSGGYSSTFGRLGTTGVSGLNGYVGNAVGRVIRTERSAIYTTPTFSGFNAQVEYSPGNDNAPGASANNNNQVIGVGARYVNKDLNAMLFHIEAKAGGNPALGTVVPSNPTVAGSALAAGQNVKWDFAAANYKLGDLTVYGGFTRTTTSNNVEKSKSANVAAKYIYNQWAFMGNVLVRGGNAATNFPRSTLIGAGIDYFLSPNVTWYWRLEDVNKINVLGQRQMINAFGLRVGF
jgi:predicted porin